MEIDWVTFSAQIINLIVLGWLLKRFLYKPILNAIDAREKSISDRVSEAKSLGDKAKDELSKLKSRKDDFEKERYALLNKTKEECEDLKARMLSEAKKEVESQRKAWLDDLEKQKKSFYATTSEAIIKSFINLADKSLKDLANTKLETQMTEIFKAKIKSLKHEDLQSFRENALESGKITAYFSFKPSNKSEVSSFIKDTFELDDNIEINFETNEKLICGIEISAKEKSLSWSMKEHLNNFTKELKSALSGE